MFQARWSIPFSAQPVPGAEKLPVEVVAFEAVPVDEDQGAHPGPGQDVDHGSAEPPEADNPDARFEKGHLFVRSAGFQVADIAQGNDTVFKGGDFNIPERNAGVTCNRFDRGHVQHPAGGCAAEAVPIGSCRYLFENR